MILLFFGVALKTKVRKYCRNDKKIGHLFEVADRILQEESCYAKALTWSASELFKLAALFLWMMFCFANLSSIDDTLGSKASATPFSLVLRKAFTALRAVL